MNGICKEMSKLCWNAITNYAGQRNNWIIVISHQPSKKNMKVNI